MWIKKSIYNQYKKLKKDIEEAGKYDKVLRDNNVVIISEIEYEHLLSCKEDGIKVKQRLSFIEPDNELLKSHIDYQDERIKELEEKVEKYKHMYIDEYQKRLELINFIKKEQ